MGLQKFIDPVSIRNQFQSFWEWLYLLFRLPKGASVPTQLEPSSKIDTLSLPSEQTSAYSGQKGMKALSGEGLVVNTERLSSGYLTVRDDEIPKMTLNMQEFKCENRSAPGFNSFS